MYSNNQSGFYPDIETWIHDADVYNKIFRVWVKNPNWDGKDLKSQYLDDFCVCKRFVEIIVLPDNDVLIGMCLNSDSTNYLEYYKLSEIYFEYLERDNASRDNFDEYDDEQLPSDADCEEITQAYLQEGIW